MMGGGGLASEQSQEGKLDAMPEEGKECKTGQVVHLPNLCFPPI